MSPEIELRGAKSYIEDRIQLQQCEIFTKPERRHGVKKSRLRRWLIDDPSPAATLDSSKHCTRVLFEISRYDGREHKIPNNKMMMMMSR